MQLIQRSNSCHFLLNVPLLLLLLLLPLLLLLQDRVSTAFDLSPPTVISSLPLHHNLRVHALSSHKQKHLQQLKPCRTCRFRLLSSTSESDDLSVSASSDNNNNKNNNNTRNMPLDLIGKTTSILVAGSVFVAIAYYRDAISVSLFVGSILNAILSKILKAIINQSRPAELATSDRVSRKPADNGMPSSHAMSLGFIGIYTALQVPWMQYFIAMYTVVSLLYRVQVKLHTYSQVLVGLVLGVANGYVWWHWTTGAWSNNSNGIHIADWITQHVLKDGVLPYPMLLVPLIVGGLTVGSIERRIKSIVKNIVFKNNKND